MPDISATAALTELLVVAKRAVEADLRHENSVTYVRDGVPVLSVRYAYGHPVKMRECDRALAAIARVVRADLVIVIINVIASVSEGPPEVLPKDDPSATDMLIGMILTAGGLRHAVAHPYVLNDRGHVRWREPIEMTGFYRGAIVNLLRLALLSRPLRRPTSEMLMDRLTAVADAVIPNRVDVVLGCDTDGGGPNE